MSQSSRTRGVIAAGNQLTAETGAEILRAGGNAFDAIIGAFFTASLTEPCLTSPAGGGFLLAAPQNNSAVLYDFFVHTPSKKKVVNEIDFFPINAEFGGTTQEFHIGMASIGVPGNVRGMLCVHREQGSMPFSEILQPTIQLCKKGIPVDSYQAHILQILKPIYSLPAPLKLFKHPGNAENLIDDTQIFRNPEYASFLECLAEEGDRFFYEGPPAKALVTACKENGGLLRTEDLKNYTVERRTPLEISIGNSQLLTNPIPSIGGTLIGFSLGLLQKAEIGALPFRSLEYYSLLTQSMKLTNAAREYCLHDLLIEGRLEDNGILDDRSVSQALKSLKDGNQLGSTTHISVIDCDQNLASMTTSNGEGSGYIIPHCGFMTNNMLGEEDLNPAGFHRWKESHRLSSMMAPSVLRNDKGDVVAFGSSGSNRIRSALVQTILNTEIWNLDLSAAIEEPRLHFENGHLEVEAGIADTIVEGLSAHVESLNHWSHTSLFFGGVNASAYSAQNDSFYGHGDSRRGGVSLRLP